MSVSVHIKDPDTRKALCRSTAAKPTWARKRDYDDATCQRCRNALWALRLRVEAARAAAIVRRSDDPEVVEIFGLLGLQATVGRSPLGQGQAEWFLGLGVLTGSNKKQRLKHGLDGVSAQALYEILTTRRTNGLATIKQLRFLVRKGARLADAQALSFEAASERIDAVIGIGHRDRVEDLH